MATARERLVHILKKTASYAGLTSLTAALSGAALVGGGAYAGTEALQEGIDEVAEQAKADLQASATETTNTAIDNKFDRTLENLEDKGVTFTPDAKEALKESISAHANEIKDTAQLEAERRIDSVRDAIKNLDAKEVAGYAAAAGGAAGAAVGAFTGGTVGVAAGTTDDLSPKDKADNTKWRDYVKGRSQHQHGTNIKIST